MYGCVSYVVVLEVSHPHPLTRCLRRVYGTSMTTHHIDTEALAARTLAAIADYRASELESHPILMADGRTAAQWMAEGF